MITHVILTFSELRGMIDELTVLKTQLADATRQRDEWCRLFGEAKKRENTWSGADADLCRRLTAENKDLRDKHDAASFAQWRADALAEGVAAAHKHEVRGLQHQIDSRQRYIDQISERRDFWYNEAHKIGRAHVETLDRLAKTDGVLMELCQVLNLDPTGDPVAEFLARQTSTAVKPVAPLPLQIAQTVWPGPWSENRGGLDLNLSDNNDLIRLTLIADQSVKDGQWRIRLNNRSVEVLIAKGGDLAEVLTIARDKMRKVVGELAKVVG